MLSREEAFLVGWHTCRRELLADENLCAHIDPPTPEQVEQILRAYDPPPGKTKNRPAEPHELSELPIG